MLIKCPECGQEISDKAKRCIHCGYPLSSEETNIDSSPSENTEIIQTVESTNDATIIHQPPKRKTKLVFFIVIVAIIVLAVAGILFSSKRSDITVSKVDINKWKLITESKYTDEYEGTVIADETKPFVAVIGYYDDEDSTPQFVYMEDGKGIIQSVVLSDEDPSLKYKAIGYINGEVMDKSDIKNIEYKDSDYEDWSYDTSCSIDIDVEMNKKVTGLLFMEVSNDLTNNIDHNMAVVIIDGKGRYGYSLFDLPLKSRGVEVSATPKFFCEAANVAESDYNIDKFSVTKGTYGNNYTGKLDATFKDYGDGLILYTEKLLDGGNRKDIGEVFYKKIYLKNQQCTIGTYTSSDSDEKMLKPSYDIKMKGYLSWNSLENL